MESLQEYLLGVVFIALICGLLKQISGNGISGRMMKMISGVAMAVTVLNPVKQLDPHMLEEMLQLNLPEMDSEIAYAKETANDSFRESIKLELEAYVLNKAAEIDADITVQILLSGDELPVPVSAAIQGKISPENRRYLSRILKEDLGIEEGSQIWNG